MNDLYFSNVYIFIFALKSKNARKCSNPKLIWKLNYRETVFKTISAYKYFVNLTD